MKKTRIFAVLAAMGLAVFGCSNGDSDSSESGSTIGGTESGSTGGTTSGGGTESGTTGVTTSGGGTESGSTGGTTSGGGTESGTTGGTTSGGDTESGTTGGTTSTGSSESGTTGGTTSGSIEPNPEGFVKIPAASIAGTENWTPESKVFVSGRNLKIASFYMSDHEVTRGEYKAVMGSDPSEADAYDKAGNKLTGDDNVKNNPVNNINWYDALVYCNKRSIMENLTPCYSISDSTNPSDWGSVPDKDSDSTKLEKWNAATCDFKANGYRLPTEAEWEWAARGGENYTYAGSDTIDEVAWYYEDNTYGTRDVKSKMANAKGLYDMSGNVYEWCWDWTGDISSDTPSTGPASGSRRCQRGGSWSSSAGRAQVAYRDYDYPNYRFIIYGFRLVRNAN